MIGELINGRWMDIEIVRKRFSFLQYTVTPSKTRKHTYVYNVSAQYFCDAFLLRSFLSIEGDLKLDFDIHYFSHF